MHSEKMYKTMKSVGIWGLVIGILTIIGGVLAGTAMIANGGRLLKKKSEILF